MVGYRDTQQNLSCPPLYIALCFFWTDFFLLKSRYFQLKLDIQEKSKLLENFVKNTGRLAVSTVLASQLNI